jgi:hypothetical protein
MGFVVRYRLQLGSPRVERLRNSVGHVWRARRPLCRMRIPLMRIAREWPQFPRASPQSIRGVGHCLRMCFEESGHRVTSLIGLRSVRHWVLASRETGRCSISSLKAAAGCTSKGGESRSRCPRATLRLCAGHNAVRSKTHHQHLRLISLMVMRARAAASRIILLVLGGSEP